MAWATYEDVLDRWVGDDAPTDTDVITALIGDAETVIKATYPGIQARITAETISLDVVIMVVVRMVTRVLRNPANVSYLQRTVGPFGQAQNFGDKLDVWLSDEEKTLLAPSNRGKAYEVNQGYAAATLAADSVWIEVR